jgi:DNA-binding XRE family transcriptional regulator
MASTTEIRKELSRLRARVAELEAALGAKVPPMPAPTADGYFPALEAIDVVLAHKLIARRQAAGLTQAQLAERAGVRVETINRLESGKHSPTLRTMNKIDQALAGAPDVRVKVSSDGRITTTKLNRRGRSKKK